MNGGAPRVSILLPNLNHLPFLEERLRSILDQTFSDWELVIVDNHSDDGAWGFFQSLPERDPRIRIFQAPRKGMYENWNNCIRLARGEYILIATSDDTMAPDFLESMVRALDENPGCDLAHCNLRIIDEKGRPSADFNWDRFYCARFFGDWIGREHVRRAPFDGVLHCGVRTVYTSITQLLLRRRLFERVGLFATCFGSAADFEWGMRASLLAHTVHVPRYLATWRVHRRQGTDMRQLDSPAQKGLLVRMVRRAFRAARRIDPQRLRPLRLGSLTYLYRKEKLFEELREARRRAAPHPLSLLRKLGLGLAWLCRDPQVFLEFIRYRRQMQIFLPPFSPLKYPRKLLAKYNLTGNLVAASGQRGAEALPPQAPLDGRGTSAANPADLKNWTPEDQQTAGMLRKSQPWLFDNPPPILLDEERFPLLIYQMGKVGSTSVDFTLKQYGLPRPVYHIHQLVPEGIRWTIRDTEQSLERILGNRALDQQARVHTSLYLLRVLREYRQNLLLYEEIRRNLDRIPWHIITMVRDPIMREISDFFFSLHQHPELLVLKGETLNRECLAKLSAELHRKFLGDSSWVLSWFDSELKKVFAVDVYQFPFDRQRGYSILAAGNCRILILKLEKLSQCFSEAMENFLQIRGLKLINQNMARQKNYHELYEHVLERVSLDAGLCSRIYQSKYCRHFYSAEERNEWTRRWTTGLSDS